jgi:hypothetical protein
VRWQAAFHSSLVRCVSRSQAAEHGCVRAPPPAGNGTAARPATVEIFTEADGQGDMTCTPRAGEEAPVATRAAGEFSRAAWVLAADGASSGGMLAATAGNLVCGGRKSLPVLTVSETDVAVRRRSWDRSRRASTAINDNKPRDTTSAVKYQMPGDLSMSHHT